MPDSVQALIAARLDTLSTRAQDAPSGRGRGRARCSGPVHCGRWAIVTRARWSRPCTSWRARSSCARPVPRRWKAKPSTASGTCSYGTSATRRSRALHALPATARPLRGSRSKAGRASRGPRRRPRPPLPDRARARPGRRHEAREDIELEAPRVRYLALAGRGRSHSTSTAQSRTWPWRSSSLRPAIPSARDCSSAGRGPHQQQGRPHRRRSRRSRRRSRSIASGTSPSA